MKKQLVDRFNAAIKVADDRDPAKESRWDVYNRVLGETNADELMKRLMWADTGFMPPLKK